MSCLVLSFHCLHYERTGKKVTTCLEVLIANSFPYITFRSTGFHLAPIWHRHFSTRDFLVFNAQSFMCAISTDLQYSKSFMYAIYSDKK